MHLAAARTDLRVSADAGVDSGLFVRGKDPWRKHDYNWWTFTPYSRARGHKGVLNRDMQCNRVGDKRSAQEHENTEGAEQATVGLDFELSQKRIPRLIRGLVLPGHNQFSFLFRDAANLMWMVM